MNRPFRKSCSLAPVIIVLIIGFVISATQASDSKFILALDWLVQSSILVPETGDLISTPLFEPEDWYPTRVPTTVLTALVKNGVYPDPTIGMNNMKIPDASDDFNKEYGLTRYSHLPDKRNPWKDPYWFRTQFQVPPDYQGRWVWLHFEGINYRADVWLNGHLIADSSRMVGMFGQWAFDVSEAIRIGRENVLAVNVYPLDHPGLPAEPQLEAFGPFGANGGLTGDIGKNVTMQSAVGWDWIPAVRDRNIGICQGVYLTTTGPVDIRFPRVVTHLQPPDTNEAALEITADIINLTSRAQEGMVFVNIQPKNFEDDAILLKRQVRLKPNQALPIRFDRRTHPQLLLEHPNLWWPNDLGHPYLYELNLRVDLDGVDSDTETVTFGIREITSTVTIVDGWARRDFFVNGKKILLKGGAWVPDIMLNRSPEKLHHELRFFKEAHLNMVRIWGGGVTPPERFFDICDEMGLLVWHDFWITGDCQGTWGKGSRDYPYEHDVFLKNARDVVLKLRNHPCIAVWTAGNEGYPRREIYVPLRNDILAELDGTRPFLPSSGFTSPPESWGQSWPDDRPAGTYSGGPYCWIDPRTYYTKMEEGKDWLFKNEVGIPSVPVYESLKKFIPDTTPDPSLPYPLNHTWGYHDACEGNGKYSLYDRAIRERYGEPKDLQDYAAKAQFVNAETYRTIFEAVNQFMDRTAGVLLWKTNPAWPSVVWQLYDWYLCPHAGYYYTKKACEPLHVQMNIDNKSVWIINASYQTKDDLNIVATIYAPDMTKIVKRMVSVDIGPSMSKKIFELGFTTQQKGSLYFVELALENKEGELVSENVYWLSQDDDFTSLSELPRVDLTVDTMRKETLRESTILHVILRNTTHHLGHFVHTSIREGKNGSEVLPSFWSDNYFSMLPGKSKEISVEYRESDTGTDPIYFKLDGWNISSVWIKIQ